jgi:hypothetical protein
MNSTARRWRPALLAVPVAGLLGACTGSPSTPAAAPPSSAPVTAAPVTAPATTTPFELLTHCGIDQARIGEAWYQADEPLVGEGRTPPPGWASPYQPGTMTVTGSVAVFRDDLGHEVAFHLRPGATGPTFLCD